MMTILPSFLFAKEANNSISNKFISQYVDGEIVKNRICFKTTEEVIGTIGKSIRLRLKKIFQDKKVSYPPKKLIWLALKEEKILLIFAQDKNGNMVQILRYKIIGTSGVSGPKLKEGDKQVPEGFYKLTAFRPSIVAYMGMSVNYPNCEDKKHAKYSGCKKLGGDILIHGSRWSTGCLAMGDTVIEQLFVLAYDTGLKNIQLIFSPCYLGHSEPAISFSKQPIWLPSLYSRLRKAIEALPLNLRES